MNAQSTIVRWSTLLIAIPLLLLAGSARFTQAASAGSGPIDVGMVALLAAPEQYDGKLIRTHGFLFVKADDDAIYLHEEDYRYGLTKNAFSLDLSEAQRKQFKKLSLKYVLLEGTVHSKSPDATYSFSGTIVDITRLESWGPWYPVPPNSH